MLHFTSNMPPMYFAKRKKKDNNNKTKQANKQTNKNPAHIHSCHIHTIYHNFNLQSIKIKVFSLSTSKYQLMRGMTMQIYLFWSTSSDRVALLLRRKLHWSVTSESNLIQWMIYSFPFIWYMNEYDRLSKLAAHP